MTYSLPYIGHYTSYIKEGKKTPDNASYSIPIYFTNQIIGCNERALDANKKTAIVYLKTKMPEKWTNRKL